MKKITFTADENVIDRARQIAHSQDGTLNSAFREWLSEFIQQPGSAQDYDSLMKRLRHVRPGRHFARKEMNER